MNGLIGFSNISISKFNGILPTEKRKEFIALMAIIAFALSGTISLVYKGFKIIQEANKKAKNEEVKKLSAESSIHAAKLKNSELSSQLQEAKSRNEKLSEELKQFNLTNEELSNEVSNLKESNSSQDKELHKMSCSLQVSEKLLASNKLEIDSLKSEIDDLKSASYWSNELEKTLENNAKVAKSQAEQYKLENEKLKEELNKVQLENKTLSSRLKDSDEQLQRIISDSAGKQTAELVDDLKAREKDTREFSEMKSKNISKLQDSLDELAYSLERKEGELRSVSSKFSKAKKELSETKKKLEEASKIIEDFKAKKRK